jgi:hypothetical protein
VRPNTIKERKKEKKKETGKFIAGHSDHTPGVAMKIFKSIYKYLYISSIKFLIEKIHPISSY